jgi:hypothetical protein
MPLINLGNIMINTDQIQWCEFSNHQVSIKFINGLQETMSTWHGAKLLVMLRQLSVPYRERDEDGREIKNDWEIQSDK